MGMATDDRRIPARCHPVVGHHSQTPRRWPGYRRELVPPGLAEQSYQTFRSACNEEGVHDGTSCKNL